MNLIMERKYRNCMKVAVFLIKKWVKLNKMMRYSKMMEIKIGRKKNDQLFILSIYQ